jgi:metal regulatory transcription factor 1
MNGQQHYNHRHSVSSGGAHEYHGQQLPDHQPDGVHMLQRTSSMPQHPYYVTEQGNPGVATLNTSTIQTYQQVPRSQPEQIPIEIQYTATGMTGSIQSSPSTFSPHSGRSPSTQDGFYRHQPAPTATYAIPTSSPIVEQPPMIHYQHVQQHPESASQQAPQVQQVHHVQEQYQQPVAHNEEQWYPGMPYQAPIEVTTIGQLPTFGSTMFDPWAIKDDYDDPTMQMPSARIESM